MVSKAKLNKEIAYELHLTEGTVKEYLNRIFQKLGTTNRTELALWAVTHRAEQLATFDQPAIHELPIGDIGQRTINPLPR